MPISESVVFCIKCAKNLSLVFVVCLYSLISQYRYNGPSLHTVYLIYLLKCNPGIYFSLEYGPQVYKQIGPWTVCLAFKSIKKNPGLIFEEGTSRVGQYINIIVYRDI